MTCRSRPPRGTRGRRAWCARRRGKMVIMPETEMTPNMYGPDFTFAGVPRAALESLADDRLDIAIVGAPYDGGTSHRPGTRFGPQAIRGTDYLPHDGSRPHLA